ncbi:hypothetical protein TNCV_3773731 [Trichonephila clavipes]|nr:hypothetical protein TNCV_3773731 [Trichonephila clavipes]
MLLEVVGKKLDEFFGGLTDRAVLELWERLDLRFRGITLSRASLHYHGSHYASVPVEHLVKFKERYENLTLVLNKRKHTSYGCSNCDSLKTISKILGQKGPSLICEWASRDNSEHWIKTEWPKIKSLTRYQECDSEHLS